MEKLVTIVAAVVLGIVASSLAIGILDWLLVIVGIPPLPGVVSFVVFVLATWALYPLAKKFSAWIRSL